MDMYQKREMRKKQKMVDKEKSFPNVSINWYPGHMAKTKRLIKENINLIDIIYEVIDARVPYSSKIKDIDELIRNKPRILIMTKYDLCDKDETNKFIKNYENMGYHVLKYDLTSDTNMNNLFDLSNLILKDKIDKLHAKGLKKDTIRALVIGIPNVGKSTLINKIVKRKIAVTGNKPGVTKSLSWIRVGKNIDLMDSPGILWPKLEQDNVAFNLACTTAIKEEILPVDDVAVYIIKFLYKYYKNILEKEYGVCDIEDFVEVYETIGKKKGLIGRGGIVDYDKVTSLILNDIKLGKIKNITFDRFRDE